MSIPAPPRPATPKAKDAFFQEMLAASKVRRHRKSSTQRMIDGETGPPMTGVLNYPFSTSQRLYLSDFRAMASSTVTHPFVTTTVASAGSIPFNILSGSAFDDDKIAGCPNWRSETTREYVPRSIAQARATLPTGVRSECVQFLS